MANSKRQRVVQEGVETPSVSQLRRRKPVGKPVVASRSASRMGAASWAGGWSWGWIPAIRCLADPRVGEVDPNGWTAFGFGAIAGCCP
jgi:hypothetical protein